MVGGDTASQAPLGYGVARRWSNFGRVWDFIRMLSRMLRKKKTFEKHLRARAIVLKTYYPLHGKSQYSSNNLRLFNPQLHCDKKSHPVLPGKSITELFTG